MVGHRMRFLVGEENGIINACITTSKEELDYQFQYPGKNKVVKEYMQTSGISILGETKKIQSIQ